LSWFRATSLALTLIVMVFTGCSAGTDSPQITVPAELRGVSLSRPTHLVPRSTTCETFQDGHCAELRWGRVDGLQAGEFTALQVSPTDPNVIYAGIDANDLSLWRSDDAGATWTRKIPNNNSAHTSGVAVSPANPDVVLYTTLEGDVYRTSDGGENWEPVLGRNASYPDGGAGGTQFTAVAFSIENQSVAYATATSGARTRVRRQPGPSDFYATKDAGLTWRLAGICDDCGAIHSIVAEPGDSELVWISGVGGVQKSTDGGQTWSGNLLGNHSSMTTIGLALNPADSRILLAASSEAGVFRTEDGGQTWREVNVGLQSFQTHRVAFAPSEPQVAYLTTHDGVYRSGDGGQTWEQRSDGLTYTFLHAITIDPTNADIVYAGTASEVGTAHMEHFNGLIMKRGRPYGLNGGLHKGEGLYKTTDGGHTWHRSDTGLEETGVVTMAPHPLLPFNFWTAAAAGRGAFVTPDAGDTWHFSPVGAAHYTMVFAFSRSFPTALYLSSYVNSDQLVVTTDGGGSWENLTEDLIDGVGQRVRDLGLFLQSQRPNLHLHGLAVAPSDARVVYAGSVVDTVHPVTFDLAAPLIFKSRDGGVTWAEMDDGFPVNVQTSINAIVVHPTDPDIAYVMTSPYESETAIGIYKTTDGGEHWSAANHGLGDLNTNDLQLDPLDPNILYVATDGGVDKTIDGAQTWEPSTTGLPKGPVYDLALDPINPLVLYAATTNGVYKTKDGGGQWYEVNLGLPLVSESLRFGHDRVVEVDATGRVVYISMETGPKHAYQQHHLYRAILEPLETVKYVFELKGNTLEVESTSHVYGLVLDQDERRIDFTAAGPTGTLGRTTVTIPTTLLLSPFIVTIDGAKVQAASRGETITLEYRHIGTSEVTIKEIR